LVQLRLQIQIVSNMGQNFAGRLNGGKNLLDMQLRRDPSGTACSTLCNRVRSGDIAERIYQIRQPMQQIERVDNRLIRQTAQTRSSADGTHPGSGDRHFRQTLALAIRYPGCHILPFHFARFA
jgi:hypothetical protein